MTTKKLSLYLEKNLGAFSFAMFLRAARTSADLTQVKMAQLLGISKGTLCDIEKGRQLVSPSLAQKISKKVGFSEKLAIQACLQDQLKKAKIN